MHRGALLLLLASLMRHACNWLSCPPPPIPASRKPTSESGTAVPADASSWQERIKIQQAWITTSLSAQHSALEVALRQPKVLTPEEQEDMPRFFSLTAPGLVDVLPKEDSIGQFQRLIRSLQRVYTALRRVYYSYALPVMTYVDFLRFAKDCNLLGEKRIPKRAVEVAARQVWRAPETLLASEIGGREISPSQFIELVIRVSMLHNRRAARDITVHGVIPFITEVVIPHALRTDLDRFKQSFRHTTVQVVIAKHKVALRRAFKKYALDDGGEGMSKQAFLHMSRDCHWTTRILTTELLGDIFRRVQLGDSAQGMDVMDFNEWLEAICAIAVYHRPNPFYALHHKVAPFIEEKIIAELQL